MMGRYYLDMEFTHGNYYLGDVLEIALVTEDGLNEFHGLVQINYPLPRQVTELTKLTDHLLSLHGRSWKDTITTLIDFIVCREEKEEEKEEGSPVVIIAHGGYLHDFPLLLTNCMKWYLFQPIADRLKEFLFVDSLDIFRDNGYTKPGLDSLCQRLGIVRNSHSAITDAHLLRIALDRLLPSVAASLMNYTFTFGDIVSFVCGQLPVPIETVYDWAWNYRSYRQLESALLPYVHKRTALNEKQNCKIAVYYFKCMTNYGNNYVKIYFISFLFNPNSLILRWLGRDII